MIDRPDVFRVLSTLAVPNNLLDASENAIVHAIVHAFSFHLSCVRQSAHGTQCCGRPCAKPVLFCKLTLLANCTCRDHCKQVPLAPILAGSCLLDCSPGHFLRIKVC